MEGNILTKKFVDSEIKLLHIRDLYLFEVVQICCTPIISDAGLFFICEVRKKEDE